ncbi:biotin/lipoyl-containing protein [Telmatospirillum siberiense]|nr:biotin/lipoyl-containing protein [Telmatospirillum siberiense]
MLRKFNINVDGRRYDVEVEENSSLPQATTWRSSVPLAVVPAALPPAANAPAAQSPAPAPVSPPAPAHAQPSGAGDVAAPLAGVVDSIDVRIGQVIAVGDRVAVIEAMKMKTDIFAKTAGTVQRIDVKVHDSVDTGQTLLSIS